jgi:hypothetical protein
LPRPELDPWSPLPPACCAQVIPPLKPCQAAHKAGIAPRVVPGITLGLLTHEAHSFGDSLKTYEDNGLFDVVPEILVYVSARTSREGGGGGCER